MSTVLVVAGDINVRLDRPTDPAAVQLTSLLAAYGLSCRVRDPTHNCGGLLDIVATRDDLPLPSVDVIDVDLSDHLLLRWSMPSTRPPPVYTTSVRRPWRNVDVDVLHDAIRSSRLGRLDLLPEAADVDTLAALYDTELQAIADHLAPARTVTVRRRASDPWFDDECRRATRVVRTAERLARHFPSPTNATAWTLRRREYRTLLRAKRDAFWRDCADATRDRPRDLWSTFDRVLGRGCADTQDVVGASTFHVFFDHKVNVIRDATSGAGLPTFTSAPANVDLSCLVSVTQADVIAAIQHLPDKQCATDIIPTWLFKLCARELAPFLSYLFSRSFAVGVVPCSYKAAYVTPLLKKPGLDRMDARSYRPISNAPTGYS